MELLQVSLSEGMVMLIFLVLSISAIVISYIIYDIRIKANRFEVNATRLQGEVNERNALIGKFKADANGLAQDIANQKLEEWKQKELEMHRTVITDSANEHAQTLFQGWIIEKEKELRKDAVIRSIGVHYGRITEHLVPFSEHLSEFDPRDIRFIGSPVDLMIFSGATANKKDIDIYFVEVKTEGNQRLSKKQKAIYDALKASPPRVHWHPIYVPGFKWDVPDEDGAP